MQTVVLVTGGASGLGNVIAEHFAALGQQVILSASTLAKAEAAIAKLDKIQFVSGLPKTRSGKIMRRILRKIAENDFSNLGDTSTLLNPEIVEEIKDGKV